jgi:hypothetical protein
MLYRVRGQCGAAPPRLIIRVVCRLPGMTISVRPQPDYQGGMLPPRNDNLGAFQLERRPQPGYQGGMLPPRNDNPCAADSGKTVTAH